MSRVLKIGNAQGFWGDRPDAPATLVKQVPDLDYLTLDYLAEVSMSILAMQREKDPQAGFARDFLEVVQSLVPYWKGGRRFKVVCNAGGLNPKACAMACLKILREGGLPHLKVGLVTGDDVLGQLKNSNAKEFSHLETGESITSVQKQLVTANAYLGAEPVVKALQLGADLVVTGRVADPSLTLAPCIHEFGWGWKDFDRLAGGTVAGHLIECGTQVCGGISTDWLDVKDPANMGFPVVEISEDGSCIVTKPAGTGGEVTERTVREQLLYEIGDPGNYLSPDLTVSFLTLSVEDQGNDRVRVRGATGAPASSFFKVSAAFRDGFWAQGLLTIVGQNAVEKARRTGKVILQRVADAGFALRESRIECLGSGACLPESVDAQALRETVLRVSVSAHSRSAVERFARELAPLVTSGPQGVTGYAAGRPKVHPVFSYWPCLVQKLSVQPIVEVLS